MALIEVRNNTKIYQTGNEKLYANKDISFSIEKGELVIILGASGAGKSTLLKYLGRDGHEYEWRGYRCWSRHCQI